MEKITITKKGFILFIMIFFSLKIGAISYLSNYLNILWHVGAIIMIIYGIGILSKDKKMQPFDLIVIIFYIVLTLSTIINKGSLSECIKELIAFYALYITMSLGINKDAKKYIKIMNNFLIVYTIINTLSAIIFYPNSMFRDNNNPIFFLGGDNTSIRLYIASILFYFLNNYIKTNKINIPIFPLLNLFIFSMLRDIGGGKVCFIILFIGFIYLNFVKEPPKKVIRKIMIFNIILFLMLVILNKMSIFSFFIVNLLHRDLTLTDRTVIWEVTIDKIINKPILGYGIIDGLKFQAMLPFITGINAHNTYLMILFNGGVILFILFIYLFVLTLKKFDSFKHSKWLYAIPIALLSLSVRAQIEGWDVVWIILFLKMAYSYDRIQNIIENKEQGE